MDRKIVEGLRAEKPVKAIARELRVGKPRVRMVREKAEALGYLNPLVILPPYPEALFPDVIDGRSQKDSVPDQLLNQQVEWIKDRLLVGWSRVTLFVELPVKGIGRSSFYRFIERHNLYQLSENKQHALILPIVHRPAEALILDWGKLRDVLDPETKKKKILWALAAVLGYSRLMMVRLVWTNDVPTTLQTIEDFFRELGGVPERVTSDNPKCFCLEASYHDPLLNPAFERFAAHYGFRIECLPPRDPEKKGKIERLMPYVRRLYEAHGDRWEGLEESQNYLNRKVAIANERKHGTTMRRPIDVFTAEEKVLPKPLPALGYECEAFSEATVRRDGFVRFQNKYYAVGEVFIGKEVALLGSKSQVSIFYQGQLLEVYEKITDQRQTHAVKEHLKKTWQKVLEDNSHYLERAQKLGSSVEEVIRSILSKGGGFVDVRQVWGILSLDKSYSAEAINEACRIARTLGEVRPRVVKQLLEISGAFKRAPESIGEQRAAPTSKFSRPIAIYKQKLNERNQHHESANSQISTALASA